MGRKLESMLIACRRQILPVKFVCLLGIVLTRRSFMGCIGQKGEKIACRVGGASRGDRAAMGGVTNRRGALQSQQRGRSLSYLPG